MANLCIVAMQSASYKIYSFSFYIPASKDTKK